MKKIKQITLIVIVIISVFGMTVFTACNKGDVKYNDTTLVRPCENVICLNGGSCLDGNCQCPVGYEGVKCEIKWNQKFVGNYTTTDNCYTGTNGFYDVDITPNTLEANKIVIYNLGIVCPSHQIDATINPEKTSFIINMQKTCGDIYSSGYGNISTNGNYINVYLKSRDSINHTSTDCSMILNRK
jgi:hypothetical protein